MIHGTDGIESWNVSMEDIKSGKTWFPFTSAFTHWHLLFISLFLFLFITAYNGSLDL